MRKLIRYIPVWLALAGLSLTLAACQTLSYRQVQRDFDVAVQQDNTGKPFTDLHGQIVETLTTNYIAKLEPKLRPNAWMLRAISSWRSGQLAQATVSAKCGLAEPALQPHSRDAVILKMVPGLVVDSELMAKWRGMTNTVSEAQYAPFARDFKTALRQFNEAQAEIGAGTPESVIGYFHFEKWRVLENWNYIIARICDDAAAINARADARGFLQGKLIEEAIQAERDALPPGSPLRQFIRAKGGG